MWNMVQYAGTTMAIAGLGATYYVLKSKDIDLEARNHNALMEAQGLAGVSNHPDSDLIEFDINNNNHHHINYSNLFGSGETTSGKIIIPPPCTLTASQNFLKTNLHNLAKGSGIVEGLNVTTRNENEVLIFDIKSKDSGTFDVRRIVSRAETDPSLYPRRSSSTIFTDDFVLGTQSEHFGYLRKTILLPPRKIPEVVVEVELENILIEPPEKSQSSRSVFGVETCSQFQFYSEENISKQEQPPENNSSSSSSPKIPLQETSTYTVVNKRKREKREQIPIISSSLSELQRKKQDKKIKKPKPPKIITSNLKYVLKSVTENIQGKTETGSAAIVNPYLTRAEPINFELPDPKKKYSKGGPKSCSTTEKFQRQNKVKRENFNVIRRCDTTPLDLGRDCQFTRKSSSSQTHPTPTTELKNKFENEQKDSIEFLFPPCIPEESNVSVHEKSCTTNIPQDCVDDDTSDEIDEPKQLPPIDKKILLEYQLELKKQNKSIPSSVTEMTFSEEFIPVGPIRSSIFNFEVGPSSATQTYPNEIAWTSPIMINNNTNNDDTSGGVGIGQQRNSGIISSIPTDSWMMLPLRLLPGEMVPWGLIYFIPFIIFILGIIGYIFVSLTHVLSSIFGGGGIDILPDSSS